MKSATTGCQPGAVQASPPTAAGGRPDCALSWTGLERLDAGEAAWLQAQGERAAAHLGARGEVRVGVVDDATMSAAHARHLGDDSTTDVMTFDLRSDEEMATHAPLDVDVLVCVDVARREGQARGHGPARELLLYVVHAMLHCLGYDDHHDDAARAMHAREDEVLRAIGVGAVYAGSAGIVSVAPAPSTEPA